MPSLWPNESPAVWHRALDSYSVVVARQGVARLPDLDLWYRDELPAVIARRRPRHVTLAELVELTEWKMARGVWRAPNLVLVKGNDADLVKKTSAEALASATHLDMSGFWTPTAERYLSRVTKAHVLAAVAEAISPDTAQRLSGLKKGDLVAAAQPGLVEARWLPTLLRTQGVEGDAGGERDPEAGWGQGGDGGEPQVPSSSDPLAAE